MFFALTLNVSAKTVTIAQLTDIHLGCGKTGDKEEAMRHFKEAIAQINANKDIDFVAITGDNIDTSKPKGLKEFCLSARAIKKPYYIIMGNHDAHKVAGIPKDTYMLCVNKLNKYQKKDDANYQFAINNDLQAVFLDGVVPNVPSSHGYFSEDTVTWFRKIVKENKHKKLLVFQHFPIVPPRDEPARTILHSTEYGNVLLLNNNILLIASGHYHQARVQTDENGTTHISTPSLLSEAQYAIIKVTYDDGFCSYPKNFKVDVEFKDVSR